MTVSAIPTAADVHRWTRASRIAVWASVVVLVVLASALLSGCDLTGAEAAAKLAEQREADGKAVGSACRHAGRAIEDCYTLNPKAQRSAIFAGWREMDEYMRENKLEGVAPSLAKAGAKGDEADAAGIVLIGRVVQTLLLELLLFGCRGHGASFNVRGQKKADSKDSAMQQKCQAR